MPHQHELDASALRCVEIAPGVCLEPFSHGGSPHITNPDGSMAGGETEHLAGFWIGHEREFDPRPPVARTMLDGSSCWCVSQDEPHNGWIHSPTCESYRDDRWWTGRCLSAVNVDPHLAADHPVWGMSGSLEGGDLTLTPSIRCLTVEGGREHTFHGWVRNGGWVPA